MGGWVPGPPMPNRYVRVPWGGGCWVSPDRGEGAMGLDVSGGDWPNGLTETAARRDDGTLHARFGDSYRIQLRSVRAGTRLAACWTLPRPLAGRDWALEQ